MLVRIFRVFVSEKKTMRVLSTIKGQRKLLFSSF